MPQLNENIHLHLMNEPHLSVLSMEFSIDINDFLSHDLPSLKEILLDIGFFMDNHVSFCK